MPARMDHVADVKYNGGAELYRLRQLYPFPEFVKNANYALHLDVPAGVPATVYADPVRKQFPCHSGPSTWLSHLFFAEKRAEFHPKDRRRIEERLAGWAEYHKIGAACAGVAARWAELHKAADDNLPDSAFAYVWRGDNGTVERRLPMRSPLEVKAAAEYLGQYRDSFPLPVRRTMAAKILEKAAALGAAIGPHREFLERQAGRGVCDPAAVAAAVEKRALAVPEDAGVTVDDAGRRSGGLRAQFRKMAATVRDFPKQVLHPDNLTKLADTMDQLDRALGLTRLYGAGLDRPEDVVFSATFGKVSADLAAHVPTTSGKLYEKAAFRKLAVADLESLFGTEFADRVRTPLGEVDCEKMAEEVATLPRPDAQLLDGLLSENGITPVLTKAAAAKAGFDRAEMEAIAAEYARA